MYAPVRMCVYEYRHVCVYDVHLSFLIKLSSLSVKMEDSTVRMQSADGMCVVHCG